MEWHWTDRTEILYDDTNPGFEDKFKVVYNFKKDSRIRLKVYDI